MWITVCGETTLVGLRVHFCLVLFCKNNNWSSLIACLLPTTHRHTCYHSDACSVLGWSYKQICIFTAFHQSLNLWWSHTVACSPGVFHYSGIFFPLFFVTHGSLMFIFMQSFLAHEFNQGICYYQLMQAWSLLLSLSRSSRFSLH